MRLGQESVALVTGGASGLGAAIATRLKEQGARVVITDIRCDLGRATAQRGDFTFREHDVSSEEQWTKVVQEVERLHGRLTILVNNAGVLGPADRVDPECTPLADWKMIFAVNVEGVFLGCKAAIPAMRRAQGGSIINISSVAGLLATPYATAYGASKAAVRQLTKSVAQYCAQQRLNVRCNSVHPGDVRTEAWSRRTAEVARVQGVAVAEVIAAERRLYPAGDFPGAVDVAAAVAYLASEEARFVTGSELLVDGGLVNCDTYRWTIGTDTGQSAMEGL